MNNVKRGISTRDLVLCAILTAIVFILQYIARFVSVGPISISLVQIPIVIGAAICGAWAGAWLGFIFGIVVLLSADPMALLFMTVNIPETILLVLIKGIACGFVAGIVYKLLEKFNRTTAAVSAAIISPIVNTVIFLIGCRIFFWNTFLVCASENGYSDVTKFIIFGVGANFLFEFVTNIILSPVVVRLLSIKRKAQ